MFEAMMWQDVVFLIGGFIGAGILLPSLYDSQTTVPLTTSMLQVGLISVFAYTFWTLAMPLSAFGASLRVIVWIGIATLRNDKQFELDNHSTN